MALDVVRDWSACRADLEQRATPCACEDDDARVERMEDEHDSYSAERVLDHCLCWSESDQGDDPCCWCGARRIDLAGPETLPGRFGPSARDQAERESRGERMRCGRGRR